MTCVDLSVLPQISQYFDQFLPTKIGQFLLPDLRSLTSRFSVMLREDPRMCWAVRVNNGVLMMVCKNGMPTDCRFSVDSITLLAIVSGQLAPQQAFFQRRADIAGDLTVGMKTAAVLAQFFKKYPFKVR